MYRALARTRAVHTCSDQIGRKCDQIFTNAIILWIYTRHLRLKYLLTSYQATELWSSQKLKNYIQDCIWLFEQAWKLRTTKDTKFVPFQENPFPYAIAYPWYWAEHRPILKGLAMIFTGQENPFIIFRSKEIYIYFKTNNKIPVNLL